MKRTKMRAGYSLEDVRRYVTDICSPDMTPEEREGAINWFADAELRAAFIEMAKKREVEIIGYEEDEGPRIRKWKHSQLV